RFKKHAIRILDNFIDWNISRQIVWGIRIPAWKCDSCAKKGKSTWVVTEGKTPVGSCKECGGFRFEQDTDTFDTWFSSSQWPFATLQTIDNEPASPASGVASPARLADDALAERAGGIRTQNSKPTHFNYFYPTSVMETGYDILPAWVARMIMMGYFATNTPPFTTVFLHGMVRDKKGQKMSKSKGNVINPLEMIDKYGADALRAALIFGTAEGNDTALSEEKITGMRNFANKVWNIGRFISMNRGERGEGKGERGKTSILNTLKKEFEKEKKEYIKYMNSYRFSLALGLIYEFLWHRYADYYIEQLKEELKDGTIEVLQLLETVYCENLKMLHPFMPYVTEAVWKVFYGEKHSILEERLK
ncbi:class I tRNA ligase family protein, partial [Candidatus Roizmanbacteria bacterium]|nr:class I tRNA ligase family protein [Candidatus Roizmanbacteria bacterium]